MYACIFRWTLRYSFLISFVAEVILARRVWLCEALKWWRVKTWSIISSDVGKSLVVLPIRSCMRNFLSSARNKVPPHQDLLWKGKPTNQQNVTSVPALELDTGTTRPEIPETRWVNRLTIDLCIACQ